MCRLIGTTYGDANLDGSVNASDFQTLARNFDLNLFGWSAGDSNGDGRVDFSNFILLSTSFGKTLQMSPVSHELIDSPLVSSVND